MGLNTAVDLVADTQYEISVAVHVTPALASEQVKFRAMIRKLFEPGFGLENHTIRGKEKMQTRVSLALAVMMVRALGQVKAGRKHQQSSLVQPIPAIG